MPQPQYGLMGFKHPKCNAVIGAPLVVIALLLCQVPTAFARSYTTTFPLTENPISESSNWINGKANGSNWSNVRTTANLAFGMQSSGGGYDDSTALVTGSWGPNQTVAATVRVVTADGNNNEEVELRVRSSISGNPCPGRTTGGCLTGYEIQYSTESSNPYIVIVRWNGPLGSFTNLALKNSSCAIGRCYVQTGDIVKATVNSSNVITMYINGTQVLQATDGTFTAGAPGIGFYTCCSTDTSLNANFGFSSFTADDGQNQTPPAAPTNLSAIVQ